MNSHASAALTILVEFLISKSSIKTILNVSLSKFNSFAITVYYISLVRLSTFSYIRWVFGRPNLPLSFTSSCPSLNLFWIVLEASSLISNIISWIVVAHQSKFCEPSSQELLTSKSSPKIFFTIQLFNNNSLFNLLSDFTSCHTFSTFSQVRWIFRLSRLLILYWTFCAIQTPHIPLQQLHHMLLLALLKLHLHFRQNGRVQLMLQFNIW